MTSIDTGYPNDNCRVTHKCDICGRESCCMSKYSPDVAYRTANLMGYTWFMVDNQWRIACSLCKESLAG